MKTIIIKDMDSKVGPALGELAEDWLEWKDPGLASRSSMASDRARRGDLRRWALAILDAKGRTVESAPASDMNFMCIVR